MKKIIAGLIALTAAVCSMTSCTDNKSGNSKEGTKKSSVQQTTEGTVPDADYDRTDMGETIGAFIDAFNARDYKKTFEMQMPDGIMDVMEVVARTEDARGQSVEELIKVYQDVFYKDADDNKIDFKGIKKTEPVNESEMASLSFSFDMYEWMVDYVADNGGVEGVDPEKLNESFNNIDIDDISGPSNITEAYFVTVELGDHETGGTYEGVFYLLGYKGGWKINAQYLQGIGIRAEESDMNEEAENLYKAAMVSLAEMDEEGVLGDTSAGLIISSDETKDLGVPEDFDPERFRKKLGSYYPDAASEDRVWFVEIKDGRTVFAAVYDTGKAAIVGHYPDVTADGSQYDGMTYDEIYDKFCREING